MTYVIYTATFGAVVLLCLGIGGLVQKTRELIDAVSVKPNDLVSIPVIGPFIAMVGTLNEHPILDDLRADLEQKLIYAGAPGGRMNAGQFLACVELVAVAVFLVNFIGLSMTVGLSVVAFIFSMIVGGLMLAVGFAWLDSVIEDRKKATSRQFPYFLDLAVMSMEAGASFLETVSTYVKDNEGQEMADEFVVMLSEISLGKTIEEALISLDERLTSDGIKNALKALVQGERMGTPLSQVLRDQADAIRFIRSQAAERAAEEMKLQMQGPAMLLLISVLLLILGPAIVNVADNSMF